MGGRKIEHSISVRKLEGRDRSEDLGIDRKII
jgi:hypothetical protein